MERRECVEGRRGTEKDTKSQNQLLIGGDFINHFVPSPQ